jgi:hypothetical protein
MALVTATVTPNVIWFSHPASHPFRNVFVFPKSSLPVAVYITHPSARGKVNVIVRRGEQLLLRREFVDGSTEGTAFILELLTELVSPPS